MQTKSALSAIERRGPARKHVAIPAIAACEDGQQFRCVLRDVSATGAKIGILHKHRLPDRFTIITGDHPEGFPVVRVWQRGDFMGVRLALPDAST